MYTLKASVGLSLEEKSWWKVQVLQTGGVKGTSKYVAVQERSYIQISYVISLTILVGHYIIGLCYNIM